MKNIINFLSYLAQFFLELEMFQMKSVQKAKTRVVCSVTFFENRAFCAIMWKNVVELDRPHIIQ
jgi:hypothetical protein